MPEMQKPEGTYKFYKDDRESIKARSMLPTDTLRYIEALEQIAQEAFEYWHVSNRRTPEQEEAASKLYDALAIVDFMD